MKLSGKCISPQSSTAAPDSPTNDPTVTATVETDVCHPAVSQSCDIVTSLPTAIVATDASPPSAVLTGNLLDLERCSTLEQVITRTYWTRHFD